MVVFDLLFNLFRIALWPSVGKELSSWLFHLCCFYLCVVLIVGVPLFGVKSRMWNSIVSVPDRCLFIYYTKCTQLFQNNQKKQAIFEFSN